MYDERSLPNLDAIYPLLNYDAQEELRLLLRLRQDLFKLHPFKVGDIIKLIDPPNITDEEAPGWAGYRHLLSYGSTGSVAERSCSDHGFGILFKVIETFWVDETGNHHELKEPQTKYFNLAASRFELVSNMAQAV